MVETPAYVRAPLKVQKDDMAHASGSTQQYGSSSTSGASNEGPNVQPLQQDVSHQVKQLQGCIPIVPSQKQSNTLHLCPAIARFS